MQRSRIIPLAERGLEVMNSRERVLTSLSHQEPDRVPIQASFTPEFARRLREHLGLHSQGGDNPHGGAEHDLEKILGLDIIQYSVGIANSYYLKEEEEYVCEWGIKWKKSSLYHSFRCRSLYRNCDASFGNGRSAGFLFPSLSISGRTLRSTANDSQRIRKNPFYFRCHRLYRF